MPQGPLLPWTWMDPKAGNHWRALAKGFRVYSFPIWLYCDNTSGNLSKKWNKHNSFLFMVAGLPHSHTDQEYNVHFLCTSNTAPPLEMLDGILNQLESVLSSVFFLTWQSCRSAWNTGILAWDCVHQEPVLVIPFVVTLPADNPMQSELACHIGLKGHLFCRMCTVQGKFSGTDKETKGEGRDDETDWETVGESENESE